MDPLNSAPEATYNWVDINPRMDPLSSAPEITYNWVDITADFFDHIQGMKLTWLRKYNLSKDIFYNSQNKIAMKRCTLHWASFK